MKLFWLGYLIGLALGLWIAFGMVSDIHKDAINHGVAHYEVDPKSGTTSFKWNDHP